jgi:hypothetical protein
LTFDQVNGIGKFDPKKYWASDDPNSLRNPEVTEKAMAKAVRRALRKGNNNVSKGPKVPKGPAAMTRVGKSKRKIEKDMQRTSDRKTRSMSKREMDALEMMILDLELS